jgi:CDP-diacylglycerol--serine O-phosphatidyltransferase
MRIRKSVVLPNLITIGNGICGFAALVKVLKVNVVAVAGGASLSLDGEQYLRLAAWLVLLGMVFDVFDGRVARMTGKTSELGAQLDSLCDLVTFGLVPALMVVRLNMVFDRAWQNLAWFLCLLYFIGALLRLARFNCENDPDESAHLCFRGLPSPAAAGCIATSVIFYLYIRRFEADELQVLGAFKDGLQSGVAWIPRGLPFLAALLGFTMVFTRFKFDHVAGRLFNRNHSFESLACLIFCLILAFVIPELVLPILFLGYLLYTPSRHLLSWALGKRGPQGEETDAGRGNGRLRGPHARWLEDRPAHPPPGRVEERRDAGDGA